MAGSIRVGNKGFWTVTSLLLLAWLPLSAHAQGYQCRTSPNGASTSYCASEAFITQHFPGSSVAGHIATFGDASGQLLQDGGPVSGAVASVSNSDGSLTISPTTGVVVASLNPGHANLWSAAQTFANSDFLLQGSSTGATTFTSDNAGATNFTLHVPAANDTLVTLAASQTLTNKTLTSPVITTPTGIVKGDVGLGNVDNTSDATKNAAAVTLTNKTFNCANNTCTVRLGSDVTGQLPLANGGANNSLTASNGGVVYSDASKLNILAGTVTPGQCLLSGSSTAPNWGSCSSSSLTSKVSSLTRALSAVSGNVSYTGYGFQPTSCEFAGNNGGGGSGGAGWNSFTGFSDSSKAGFATAVDIGIAAAQFSAVTTKTGAFVILIADPNADSGAFSAYQEATVSSYDVDGFTLTWTKVGSPTTGTATIAVRCLK